MFIVLKEVKPALEQCQLQETVQYLYFRCPLPPNPWSTPVLIFERKKVFFVRGGSGGGVYVGFLSQKNLEKKSLVQNFKD